MEKAIKADLQAIFEAGVQAVDPETAVRRHVQRCGWELRVDGQAYPLDQYRRIIVVGAGKGTAPMAKALEELLRDDLSGGTIVVKYDHALPLEKIVVREAGHPVPDEAGVKGATAIRSLLEPLSREDLAICAISGGGSSLLPLPPAPLTLAEKQEVTRGLLACGATINEINSIRKHLSLIKGGWLAAAAFPARLVALILSDVVGDPLDVIASGPSVADPTTFADCLKIVSKYGLHGKLPATAEQFLEDGATGRHPETPKANHAAFSRVHNVVVGNNRAALAAASERARGLGYHTLALTSAMEGEAREAARVFAAIGKEIAQTDMPLKRPACVLIGGESTVTLSGDGTGGRNQEFALAAALALAGFNGISLLSAGTDGTDGPTDAAGAFADSKTVGRAGALGLDAALYLGDNNAYPFFDALGDLLRTGPTRTNVMDLAIMIVQ